MSQYETLLVYQKSKRAVFLYGFAKNEKDNINDGKLLSLKEIAEIWIKVSNKEINNELSKGTLNKVINYEQKP